MLNSFPKELYCFCVTTSVAWAFQVLWNLTNTRWCQSLKFSRLYWVCVVLSLCGLNLHFLDSWQIMLNTSSCACLPNTFQIFCPFFSIRFSYYYWVISVLLVFLFLNLMSWNAGKLTSYSNSFMVVFTGLSSLLFFF